MRLVANLPVVLPESDVRTTPRACRIRHSPALSRSPNDHSNSHPMNVSASPRRLFSDLASFTNSIIPEFALSCVQRLFTVIPETDGKRLLCSGVARSDLTNNRIVSILDKPWKDRDPIEVEIVQRWLERESLLAPSLSLLDSMIAAWAVEIAVIESGEIVQPATGSETQLTVDLILCVVKGSVRIAMNENQLTLGIGDTLVTDETIEITALTAAAFLWLPKSAAHDAAEAFWRRRLDALSPLIGRLLPSWTTSRLIQLIDAMSPAHVVPSEPLLFRQGEPIENVFVIAAGSVIESVQVWAGNEEDPRPIHIILDSRQIGDFVGLDACEGIATYAVSAEAKGVIAYTFNIADLKREYGDIWALLSAMQLQRRQHYEQIIRHHLRIRAHLALPIRNMRQSSGAQARRVIRRVLPTLAPNDLVLINIDAFRRRRDSKAIDPVKIPHKLANTKTKKTEFKRAVDAILDETDPMMNNTDDDVTKRERHGALRPRSHRRTVAMINFPMKPIRSFSFHGNALNVKRFGPEEIAAHVI